MSKRFCKMVMALVLGALLCMPVVANAWSCLDQGWYDNYPEYNYPAVHVDQIDFYIVSGSATFDITTVPVASYEYPGFSGWTVTSYSPTHVEATNASAPTSATWEYVFADPGPVANYTLVWYGFYEGQFQVGESDAVTNGQVYFGPRGAGDYFYTYTLPVTDPASLPPSALLMGSGILGLVILRWRRKGSA